MSKTVIEFKEDFRKIKTLGVGGFAKVYLVKNAKSKDIFAAKWCLKNPSKMREEAEILCKLRNKENIIQIVDFYYDQFENVIFDAVIMMEFLDGQNLFERISPKDYILTENKCRKFALQILQGMQAIHEKRIAHLDMKPHNVMVFPNNHGEEHLKIIDFGLSQIFPPEKDSLKVGLRGTLEFMAYETMTSKTANLNSDMWAVGVLFYMLVSGGISPFWKTNPKTTIKNVTKFQFVDGGFDQEAFKTVSEDAIDCIKSLIQTDPKKRLTAAQCLEHSWLKTEIINGKALKNEQFKRYLARRRWMKGVNVIKAMNRIISMRED